MNRFERKNTGLIKLFHQYIHENPKILDQIPDDAVLVMQQVGDEEFNRWSRKISAEDGAEGRPMVYVKITMKPGKSRKASLSLLGKLELQPVRIK